VRRLDEGDIYPAVGALADEAEWAEDLDAEDLADVLRSALHEEYANASDEEVGDALANVLDSMSPAEAFNFASALNQIGKGAGQLISDPTFAAVAQTALPILGGAAGTMIGGPVGTALGSKLGSLAASALPTRPSAPQAPAPQAPAPQAPAPRAPAPPVAAPPVPAPPVLPPVLAPPVAPPAAAPPAAAAPAPAPPAVTVPGVRPAPPVSASPVASGSAAAAQGLVLTQQPDVLRSLLATALGEHGRQTVSGVPVPQVLGLLSQIFGKAAADADELMYLGPRSDAAESIPEDALADAPDSLYADLLGADNLELAAAIRRDWLDR
jgi:hypothetical protein